MLRPLFCYEQNRRFCEEIYNRYCQQKLKKDDLNQARLLLNDAYKYGYIRENPTSHDLRTKKGKKNLISLLVKFSEFSYKKITRQTIKERGWTNSLIEQYLWVDLVLKNPYYKSKSPMKLYSFNRVIFVEETTTGLKERLEQNLVKRFEKRVKIENRLRLAPYRWWSAIGDLDLAILLLAKLLQSNQYLLIALDLLVTVRNVCEYLKGKGYYVSSINIGGDYCHWFEVRGYQNFLVSDRSFSNSPRLSIDCLPKDFFKTSSEDFKLLLKVSHWRSVREGIKGLSFLLSQANKDYSPHTNYQLLDRFTPAPKPFTEDDLYVLRLAKEHKDLIDKLKQELRSIKLLNSTGCPAGFICQQMSGFPTYRCPNFKQCKK